MPELSHHHLAYNLNITKPLCRFFLAVLASNIMQLELQVVRRNTNIFIWFQTENYLGNTI